MRADALADELERERARADRAEAGRDAERARSEALRERLDELQAAYDRARADAQAAQDTALDSLFDIAAIKLELERLMGIPVHVTTAGALRGALLERVLAEAEPV